MEGPTKTLAKVVMKEQQMVAKEQEMVAKEKKTPVEQQMVVRGGRANGGEGARDGGGGGESLSSCSISGQPEFFVYRTTPPPQLAEDKHTLGSGCLCRRRRVW